MICIEIGDKASIDAAFRDIEHEFDKGNSLPTVLIGDEKFECECHMSFERGVFFTSLERRKPNTDKMLSYDFMHVRDVMDGVAVHSPEAFKKMFMTGAFTIS